MPMILIVIALAAIVVGGAVYFRGNVEVAEQAGTPEVPTPITDTLEAAQNAADAMEQGLGGAAVSDIAEVPEASAPSTESQYANGAYTQTGSYRSPAGEETVTVSLTLADGIIASATFTGNATNPASVRNQGRFAEGYSDLVVGKSLDEVSVGVVNGSSLTGIGFMEAVEAIKVEAAARAS